MQLRLTLLLRLRPTSVDHHVQAKCDEGRIYPMSADCYVHAKDNAGRPRSTCADQCVSQKRWGKATSDVGLLLCWTNKEMREGNTDVA